MVNYNKLWKLLIDKNLTKKQHIFMKISLAFFERSIYNGFLKVRTIQRQPQKEGQHP